MSVESPDDQGYQGVSLRQYVRDFYTSTGSVLLPEHPELCREYLGYFPAEEYPDAHLQLLQRLHILYATSLCALTNYASNVPPGCSIELARQALLRVENEEWRRTLAEIWIRVCRARSQPILADSLQNYPQYHGLPPIGDNND